MRVALVHDWLTGMRGGERVLEALIALYPDSDIFTLVHVPGSVSARIEERPIRVSALDGIPGSARFYRHALPLMPRLIERFDLSGYDLVVSSSHCVAKGAIAPAGVPHVCYCHTPMRYAWDQYDAYFGADRASAPVRLAMRAVAPQLRKWDVASAGRADGIVANSYHVRTRIRNCWGRDSTVVYPPVAVDRFSPAVAREDFYLVLGALVPYKRIDLTVEAFNRMRRRLVIVGDGPERERLLAAAGPNIEFTGRLSDAEVADLLGRCRALVNAGVEDFGISIVEALAAGAPVIALAEGGAAEILAAGAEAGLAVASTAGNAPPAHVPTGILFRPQTAAGLIAAVERFEQSEFDPAVLRQRAVEFGPDRFDKGMRSVVATVTGTAA